MIKPGYKTTEFWLTLIPYVVGILMAFGVLSVDQAEAIKQGSTQIIGGLFTVLSALGYSVSRGLAKSGKPKEEDK